MYNHMNIDSCCWSPLWMKRGHVAPAVRNRSVYRARVTHDHYYSLWLLCKSTPSPLHKE